MTKAELQKELDGIIQGNKHIIKLDYFAPDKLDKLLKEIDSSINFADDLETSGWDDDFWLPLKYRDTKFTFAGSWYYGDYSIYRN
jgi:hypothetical protein